MNMSNEQSVDTILQWNDLLTLRADGKRSVQEMIALARMALDELEAEAAEVETVKESAFSAVRDKLRAMGVGSNNPNVFVDGGKNFANAVMRGIDATKTMGIGGLSSIAAHAAPYRDPQPLPEPSRQGVSDGSTASYYELPPGATQLQDLISHRNLNAQDGEIFRAIYRKGLCSHSNPLREAKKVLYYAQAEVCRLEAGAVNASKGPDNAL